MDPDAALDELLALANRIEPFTSGRLPSMAVLQDVGRLLELVDRLDGWLTAGGFLPSRWPPIS